MRTRSLLLALGLAACDDHIDRIRHLGGRDPITCVEDPPMVFAPVVVHHTPAITGWVYRDMWTCRDAEGNVFVCAPDSECMLVADALASWGPR